MCGSIGASGSAASPSALQPAHHARHGRGVGGAGGGADEEQAAATLVGNLLAMFGSGDGESIQLSSDANGREYGPDAMLWLADADGDGTVTREELTAQISAMDADGSGGVSRSEVHTAMEQAGVKPPPGPPHGPPPPPPSSEDGGQPFDLSALRELIQSADSDGDGKLSAEELRTLPCDSAGGVR